MPGGRESLGALRILLEESKSITGKDIKNGISMHYQFPGLSGALGNGLELGWRRVSVEERRKEEEEGLFLPQRVNSEAKSTFLPA